MESDGLAAYPPFFVKTFVEMSEGLLLVINSHATSRTRIVPSGHDAYTPTSCSNVVAGSALVYVALL